MSAIVTRSRRSRHDRSRSPVSTAIQNTHPAPRHPTPVTNPPLHATPAPTPASASLSASGSNDLHTPHALPQVKNCEQHLLLPHNTAPRSNVPYSRDQQLPGPTIACSATTVTDTSFPAISSFSPQSSAASTLPLASKCASAAFKAVSSSVYHQMDVDFVSPSSSATIGESSSHISSTASSLTIRSTNIASPSPTFAAANQVPDDPMCVTLATHPVDRAIAPTNAGPSPVRIKDEYDDFGWLDSGKSSIHNKVWC